MRILHLGIILALATSAFADTVKLKDGRTVQGTYLGGSPRQVRVEVGDQIQTLDVSDIERIEFGGAVAAAPAPRPAPASSAQNDRPVLKRSDPAPAPVEESRPVLLRPDPSPAPAQHAPVAETSKELPSARLLQ